MNFLKRHVKGILLLVSLWSLSIISLVTLAYAEGVYNDPEGQLNNPFKLQCDSGLIADRTVPIMEDGEYNWMFRKGQELNVQISINRNDSLKVYLLNNDGIYREGRLETANISLNWTITIPSSGHWRLELVNYGAGTLVKAHVIASPIFLNNILQCITPGDLFKND